MKYHLYPPFFIIEPQTSFSKAWEDFCRRLLNLKWRTTAIRHRTPPDRGADLLWDEEGIAYQCKATESGITGDLKTANIKASIKKAKEYQMQIGWQKYVLCTNVDLTGPQTEALQNVLPEIERLECGYWTDLCNLFHEQVTDRFRQLIPVAPTFVQRAINQAYLRTYLQQFQEFTNVPTLNVLVYSESRKAIFDLPIPSAFSVYDTLLMLRELFDLPGPKIYRELNVAVSLEYSLHIDNKEVPMHKKLCELQVDDRPLITLWKTIIWYDTGRKTEVFIMEDPQPRKTSAKSTETLSYGLVRVAVEQYKQEIEDAIDNKIVQLTKLI